MYDEQLIFKLLKQGNEKAFTSLFRKYYKDLVMFAGTFLSEKESCEDIVQSIFVNLWEKRTELDINVSIRSFLLKSVKNGCLDELRHRKVKINHENNVLSLEKEANFSVEHYILYSELISHLTYALEKLPEKQRTVFEMSRLQGIKYKDIAERMNISERTVEDRIAKTLIVLRKYLKDFLLFLVFCTFYK